MGSLSEEVRTEVLCGYICDLEAENAKLRERVAELEELEDGKRYIPQEWYQLVTTENTKLRELILDMLVDEERGHNDDGTYYEHVRLAKELGIEVGE